MNKLLKVLSVKDIHSLTLDREFNGSRWLKWLDDKGIGFVLRLRRNTLVNGKSAGEGIVPLVKLNLITSVESLR